MATFEQDIASVSVQEARDWLRLHTAQGAVCPCCNQFVKVYRRKLNSQMARWLIWLCLRWLQKDRLRYNSASRFDFDHRFNEGSAVGAWVDVRESPVRGGDYAKLLYWGLVEQKPKTDDSKDTKDTGLWRPTSKGLDFIYRRIEMPSHALVYNGRLLKLDDTTTIGIEAALGNRFSYSELMSAK